jgi:beta-lactamase superfamily II metal-dependent hydrolase
MPHSSNTVHQSQDTPPFQGEQIGAFTVLSPTRETYLDLIIQSEKTPETVNDTTKSESFSSILEEGIRYLRSMWGVEIFPEDGTSAENEMSVVQYAYLNEKSILLTGDAGRRALEDAGVYAKGHRFVLPGVDRFQVPHHGSRHNVSTEVLNTWLGPKRPQNSDQGDSSPTAIISASKDDKDHPRKSVVRALIHRGYRVVQTKGQTLRTQANAPDRAGWVSAQTLIYPEEQEE